MCDEPDKLFVGDGVCDEPGVCCYFGVMNLEYVGCFAVMNLCM